MGSNKLNNVDSHRSSPSLLGDHDNPLRPIHKRSTSSPSTSLTSLFQRLAVEAQSAGNKGSHRKVSVSPTRRRLFKRQSGNVPQKMDLADGQAGHDKVRDPARKVIQHEHPHLPKRPHFTSRSSSYSKRHASFDSPREVPLPSPSSQLSQYFPLLSNTSSHDRKSSLSAPGQGTNSVAIVPDEEYPVFDEETKSGSDSGDDSLPSAASLSQPSSPSQRYPQPNGTMHDPRMNGYNHTGSYTEPPQGHDNSHPRDQPQNSESPRARPPAMLAGSSQGPASLVFPFSRPYSLPQGRSDSFNTAEVTKPQKPVWPDRSSSASLPLPMQTPYHTLPQAATSATLDEGPEVQGLLDGDAEVPRPRPPPAPSQANGQVGSGATGTSRPSSPAVARPRTPPAPHRLDPVRTSATYPDTLPQPIARSASAASSLSSYPAPQAPVILTPPPPPTGSGRTARASYEPFLCHNAVAEDRHTIAVETSTSEYRLIVHLPGFSRDAITLATRRRRILHVVADSWAPGGGHFERRVSFGYDADLSQVRAEFDGDSLRVTIPRRISPVTWSAGV